MDLDLLPAAETGLGAPLGLMSAPGARRALAEDLAELRDAYGCALLVSLLGEHEIAIRGLLDLAEQAKAQRIEVIRFPIGDFSTPDAPEDLFPVVERILATTQRGDAAVVHCWAGRGRSGLVAACCIAARGFEPDAAIALVRRHRRRAVETPEQEEMVSALAQRWRARTGV